jgi:hypothetical protein
MVGSEVVTFVDPLMVIGEPQTARHIRILPMNQYACWPITFGMECVVYLCVLQVKPHFIRKEFQLQTDLTFNDKTVETTCKNERL